jgi:hypothetical protein
MAAASSRGLTRPYTAETLAESRQWSDAVAEINVLYESSAREGRSLDEVLAARAVIFARLEQSRAAREVARHRPRQRRRRPARRPRPCPGSACR